MHLFCFYSLLSEAGCIKWASSWCISPWARCRAVPFRALQPGHSEVWKSLTCIALPPSVSTSLRWLMPSALWLLLASNFTEYLGHTHLCAKPWNKCWQLGAGSGGWTLSRSPRWCCHLAWGTRHWLLWGLARGESHDSDNLLQNFPSRWDRDISHLLCPDNLSTQNILQIFPVAQTF